MLTPCLKVPCSKKWCKENKKCWLFESYPDQNAKYQYEYVDGKYLPSPVKPKMQFVPACDTSSFFSKKPFRPKNVNYPKYNFETNPDVCFYCGRDIYPNPPDDKKHLLSTRDHVFPRNKGGALNEGNKVWSCKKCNSHKGNMTVLEFRDKLNEMIVNKKYENKIDYFKKILIKVEFMITKLYPENER